MYIYIYIYISIFIIYLYATLCCLFFSEVRLQVNPQEPYHFTFTGPSAHLDGQVWWVQSSFRLGFTHHLGKIRFISNSNINRFRDGWLPLHSPSCCEDGATPRSFSPSSNHQGFIIIFRPSDRHWPQDNPGHHHFASTSIITLTL